MMLPRDPNVGLLLVRTDYSDEDAWRRALEAATAVYPDDDWRMGAPLRPVESADLNALAAGDIVQLQREGYLSAVAVADAQTMRDGTIMFLDLNEFSEQVGRTFRAIPQEVEPITANLYLANMDFRDFADSADADGTFRGF
jgi:hypothetical protein